MGAVDKFLQENSEITQCLIDAITDFEPGPHDSRRIIQINRFDRTPTEIIASMEAILQHSEMLSRIIDSWINYHSVNIDVVVRLRYITSFAGGKQVAPFHNEIFMVSLASKMLNLHVARISNDVCFAVGAFRMRHTKQSVFNIGLVPNSPRLVDFEFGG
ncbi:hypothetical protein ASE23_01930 [Rhizobium sp. Root73]|nr:hypothetical protein ASD36_01930 [Rhizobium sp. Root1334]KRC13322.1 hypothetical protein ASE23_01930 [Rhizobium sp. Root73]